MIEAWRAEVVGMWPALADDNVLAARMLEAQLIWVWLSTYWFLPENHTRIAAAREHHLSVPRSEALIQRWDKLARSADHAGNTVVAHHARVIADKIRGLSVG